MSRAATKPPVSAIAYYGSKRPNTPLEQLAWAHELKRMSKQDRPSEKHNLAEETVDMLLAVGLN